MAKVISWEAPAPDVTVHERPWLKTVTIKGKASFFGARADDNGCRFDFSPDLTCIIGGSMTGKSTLLDGLRMHVGAPLPKEKRLRDQVESRARLRFLAGAPEVALECPGQDPTSPLHLQWPALFHAQNELQRLAQDPDAVEDILAHLDASETKDIQERRQHLEALDSELSGAVRRLAELDEDLTEADQAFERSRNATLELDAFSEAGIEDLHRASRAGRDWLDVVKSTGELEDTLGRAFREAEANGPPVIESNLKSVLMTEVLDEGEGTIPDRWQRVCARLQSVVTELKSINVIYEKIAAALGQHEQTVRVQVERNLAALGLDGARIKEFQALSSQASLLSSYEANLNETRTKLARAEFSFDSRLENRRLLIDEQRAAFDRVIENIRREFDGHISARRVVNGNRNPLERFLKGLSQKGVTRWWNDLPDDRRPAPRDLADALEDNSLATFGMSAAVQKTFVEAMTQPKRWQLASLRCSDRYMLELKMDDGNQRRLDDLSGGQRVSVLLSLLLETSDERPLVIDQPEDELDNRFLFDTVLPALKRLKGRRQIIVATHNPNVVVNGDADQVIQLEATANSGVGC